MYNLVLSCPNTRGIVAAVAGFVTDNGGDIVESAQFGDNSTGQFFMRVSFIPENGQSQQNLHDAFNEIAKKFNMDFTIHDTTKKPKLLVAVTKVGHCLNRLAYQVQTGMIQAEIVGVVSNHEVLKGMAAQYGLPFHYLPITAETKKEQESALWQFFQDSGADLMVLARYMQVLSDSLCAKLKGKAINIHHSFLPGFKGANPYKQAYDRGVKMIGATAHYVTSDLDEGPIIEQEVIRVNHSKPADELKKLGRDIESTVLARAVKYHCEQRLLLNGNKTVVFN